MKSGIVAVAAMASVMGILMACPQAVRAEIAERTNVPDHYVLEAERQIEVFVTWLRADEEKPDAEEIGPARHAIG